MIYSNPFHNFQFYIGNEQTNFDLKLIRIVKTQAEAFEIAQEIFQIVGKEILTDYDKQYRIKLTNRILISIQYEKENKQ